MLNERKLQERFHFRKKLHIKNKNQTLFKYVEKEFSILKNSSQKATNLRPKNIFSESKRYTRWSDITF